MATQQPIPTHPNFQNLSGQRFGRLLVLGYVGRTGKRQSLWRCLCDCTKETVVTTSSLRTGNTSSCGCLHRDELASRMITHGRSKTQEYRIWHGMKVRCLNENRDCFSRYGGRERPITICERWTGPDGFERFLEDMGPRPSKKHSLDRINNEGDYEPSNCRWATPLEQGRNTRKNVFLEFNGKRMTISEWASEIGVKAGTLCYRIRKGWSAEEALTQRAFLGNRGKIGSKQYREPAS